MSNEEQKQVEIEVELTDEAIEAIETLAEERKCSFNDAAVYILKQYIEEQDLQSEVAVEKIEEDQDEK